MKRKRSNPLSHISFARTLTLVLTFAQAPLTVFAQNIDAAKPSTLTPPTAQSTNGTANTDDQSPAVSTTRENRAKAYAKLLEGQRLFAAARTGSVSMEALRSAQQAFQRAAELDPTLSEARTALAEIAFFFFNDLAQAEREALAATRINRDNLGAHRLLARVYALRSNLSEGMPDRATTERAIESLREVVRLHPTDAEAWALLGEFYLEMGRTDEAVEAIRRWAGSPPPLDVRFYQIVTKGKELTADAAHARLAEVLLGTGKVEEAFVAARRALLIEPENQFHLELLTRASSQLAQSYVVEQRYSEAVKVYNDLLRLRGIGEQPLANQRERQFVSRVFGGIVTLHRQAGQFAEASAVIERMRKVLGSEDLSTSIHAIDLLRDQGKKNEALEAARAARQKHPDDRSLLFREAVLLVESGRVAEATLLFRSRLKGGPEDYEIYIAFAGAMIQAGRGREAVEAAQKAVELAPANRPELSTQALLLLSSAQERAGDFKGSEQSLRKVLVKEPENATALNNLGYFLTERNERLNEALEMINRAVKAEPDNPSFLDSLGWVYFKLGKLNEAERYLNDAARRNPSSAVVQEHLGDLFKKQGKPEKAASAWRKALTLSAENESAVRIRAKLGETK